MNEIELRQELAKPYTDLQFDSLTDFEEFESILDEETSWQDAERATLDANLLGELYAKLDEGTVYEHHFPVNLNTAPLSLNARGNLKCKYANDLLSDSPRDYARLINEAIVYYNKPVRALIRGKQLMALHTQLYNTLSQKEIFKRASSYMKSRFSGSRFEHASYTPEKTEMLYSVCGGNDAFLKSYAKDWINSGQNPALLDETKPTLIFSTSDTGKYPLKIQPVLKIGRAQYPLGTEFEIKHSFLASVSDFDSYADMAYSKLESGIDNVRTMITRELRHPYSCFVKVSSKVGLSKRAKTLMQQALSDFKDEFENQKVTAFNLYTAICEITLRKEFENLSEMSKLSISECINRVAILNWDEVDKSGIEEI